MNYWLPKNCRSKPKVIAPKISVQSEDVLGVFLELTAWTCPHGYEADMYGDWLASMGFTVDAAGNYHLEIGDGTSRTLFAAHLDTADWDDPEKVTHEIDDDGFIVTDGTTILGADDKTGVAILVSMIRNKVRGHYTLFVGEETGGVGSSRVCRDTFYTRFDRMICFDRMGYRDVITYQGIRRCCSDAFAQALADKLNKGWKEPIYSPCDRGIFTDSANFVDAIPECTNLSVGYFGAHGLQESQSIDFLTHMCDVFTWFDWEQLPTEREPGRFDFFDDDGAEYSADDFGDMAYRSKYASTGLVQPAGNIGPIDFTEGEIVEDVDTELSRAEMLEELMCDSEMSEAIVTIGETVFTDDDLAFMLQYGRLPSHLRGSWDYDYGVDKMGNDVRGTVHYCVMCGDPILPDLGMEPIMYDGEPFCSMDHVDEYKEYVK